MTNPLLDIARSRPLTIAHRAGNGVASARAAIAAGADLIEADVWLYRGRLELRHQRTMGRSPLLWDRWSVHAGWKRRLTLAELLGAIGHGAGVLLDLKGDDARLPAAVIDALQRDGGARTVAICSHNWHLLEPFVGRDGVTVLHSITKAWRLRAVLAGDYPPFAGISIHRQFLDAAVVATLKEMAPLIVSWPVNDAATARELASWGVDGMISDGVDDG